MLLREKRGGKETLLAIEEGERIQERSPRSEEARAPAQARLFTYSCRKG